MDKRISSIGIVFTLAIGGFVWFANFESENAQGTPVSGPIVTDTIWNMPGSPYIVVGEVTVLSGITLTIEPGVEVKFNGPYSIYVDGTLLAVGTEINRINITSNIATPIPGDWGNIQINSNGHAEIEYCNISYGNYGIYLSSSNNNITNNYISLNHESGIYLSSSNNNITNNIILNNIDGIEVWGSSNNIIFNNNISSNTGNGIFIGGSSNITIVNNNFINDGVEIRGNELSHFNTHTIPVNNLVNGLPLYYHKDISGFSIDGIPVGQLILANCSNVDVKNLHINNTETGILAAYCTDILITNNNLSSNKGSGIHLYSSSNINITNNNISFIRLVGIGLERSSDNNIINNHVSFSSSGIFLSYSSNRNIVKNNVVLSNSVWGIILTEPSNNNTITDNIASYNPSGIALWGTSSNNVKNNNVSNNSAGITLYPLSNNNTITNNHISENIWGFYLQSSSYNNFYHNNVSGSIMEGITLDSSSNNSITNNDVSNNKVGISLIDTSDDNTITYNQISDNDEGFDVESSQGNRIHHNNIVNNTIQASDDTNNGNQWDNSYPSGGNYWSDFDEPGEGAYDDYAGSNQDFPFVIGDGIVDNGTIGGGGRNPYVIDSDSQDVYPFINPIDTSPPIITNLQPPDASITNDNTPIISADYNDPSGINVSSVVLIVDGIDVTSAAAVTASGVSYTPVTALSEGIHTVYLEVKDIFGNLATASWSFTVDAAIHPPVNLTTKVVNNGNNVELEWDPSPSPALDHYLIYRADSATEFDFALPYNVSTTWPNPLNTTWVDPDSGVTSVDDDFYYIVRAANFDESDISSTSNTAGVWTRTFESGISTFSLPLEPFEARDVEFYCQDMNASYIKWMNTTTHTWMKHDRGSFENITLLDVGEGYEIGFLGKSLNQTKYTFTGMPGAMITFDNDILFSGFDSDAKNLTVAVEPDGNVTLAWQEPASMGPGDWYEVYYSNTRDGFFKAFGLDYDLACPSIGFGTNTTTISGLGASNPGARLYFMVVPFNTLGIRGASTYSIGIWTEEYLAEYDTFGIPLKMSIDNTVDWYCDNIPNTVGINYYINPEHRWAWHSTRMPKGAFDPLLVMGEGYQISTSNGTKFTFIGR